MSENAPPNAQHAQIFKEALAGHVELFSQLDMHLDQLLELSRVCHEAIGRGGKIVFCGNGGSAADCQHLAAEFVVRYKAERGPLAALALTTDTSILTAHSNDYDYSTVFSRQVKALCREEDVLIGLSTSGNSPNIVDALNVANDMDVFTVAFSGRNGGKIRDIANLAIVVDHPLTARIQEAHLFMGHWLCETFDS